MTMMTKMLIGGAGLAALAAATPSAAQFGYSPYGHVSPYAYSPYSHNVTAMATQRCSAAVQNRLMRRSSSSLGGIVGALLGANTASNARVVAITQVTPRQNSVRVRGLASSGARSGYGPYGVGAYGALGYAYQPDLSFSCSVDYRGYVRDIDINRR